MPTDQGDITETETRRVTALAEMEADEGHDWAQRYAPGTFGCHELLDRVHLISSMFQQHVWEHPACLQNPEWYRLADAAVEAMEKLYQEIGAAHLGEEKRL
jgi:hypothetical protein